MSNTCNHLIFDTTGVMDTLIALQRAHPTEEINLIGMALGSLTGADKEKFLKEMEMHAYEYLSKNKKLKECKNYIHKGKKYALYASKKDEEVFNDQHFIGDFYTAEEAQDAYQKFIGSLNGDTSDATCIIVTDGNVLYTGEQDINRDTLWYRVNA